MQLPGGVQFNGEQSLQQGFDEKQKLEDAMSPLKDKQKEIDKHCRGELSFRKVTEDCAALEELEKLKDDQKNLRRQM